MNTYATVFKGRDRETSADMMHSTRVMQYKEFDGYKATKLAFKGSRHEMILVLPDEGSDIIEAARSIDVATLEGSYYEPPVEDENGQAYEIEYKVDLHLPKFQISLSADVSSIFESLGLPVCAKLDKMGLDLERIIKIQQKMMSMIDEEGAKVATVTNGDFINSALLTVSIIKDVTMTFDRPFIYFIRNTVTGSILIAGIVNNL